MDSALVGLGPSQYSDTPLEIVIRQVLDLILSLEDKIYATTDDGRFIYKSDGTRRISVWKIIGNLALIIGRVVASIHVLKKIEQ